MFGSEKAQRRIERRRERARSLERAAQHSRAGKKHRRSTSLPRKNDMAWENNSRRHPPSLANFLETTEIVVKKGKAPPTDYSALGRSMLALEGGFDAGGYRAPSNSQEEMAVMGRDLRQTLGEIACTS